MKNKYQVREREIDRQRERQRERQTDRQTDTETLLILVYYNEVL